MCARDEQTNFIPFWATFLPLAEGPFREELRRSLQDSDVLMVMITPPDKYGMVTFGDRLWQARRHVRNAKIVIGEVNEKLPIIPGGDNWMPVDAFDYLVESAPIDLYAMPGLAAATECPKEEVEPSTVIMTLIEEELINDGDTVEFGAGMPMRLGPFLENKHDLGCHTEAILPMEQLMKGVINNKRRNLCPGKTSLTGLLTWSREEEEYINGSHLFDIRDMELNNSPNYVCQNDNMVAIHSASEINIFGELNIERVGFCYFRGTGGQVEIIAGALMAKNGRSIHGITSRKHLTSGEYVSAVVPQFTYPGVASVPRHFADFVVTEYGTTNTPGPHTQPTDNNHAQEVSKP